MVVVEQTHKKLELWEAEGRPGTSHSVVIAAVKEVGGPSFFALLVIAVGFLPVFTLEGQEGRLFKPLAFTKNFSMGIAAVLAITLAPAAMRLLFSNMDRLTFRPRWLSSAVSTVFIGKIHSEDQHPISRPMMKLYHPIVEFVLDHKWLTIGIAMLVMALTVPVYFKLGSEFMPPLDEGTILYMPSTLPGISVAEATRLLQVQDTIIHRFPEVARVFGKAGRAESSTDPAPYSMMETTISLKPQDQWPKLERWYSKLTPLRLQPLLQRFWPDHVSTQQLIYGPGGINQALQIPGISNAWTMPIKARTDMLTTGIRTHSASRCWGLTSIKFNRLANRSKWR